MLGKLAIIFERAVVKFGEAMPPIIAPMVIIAITFIVIIRTLCIMIYFRLL